MRRSPVAARRSATFLGVVALAALLASSCDSGGSRATEPNGPPGDSAGPPLDTIALQAPIKAQLVLGSRGSCILRPDNSVVCWGDWGGIGPTLPMVIPPPKDSTGSPVRLASLSYGARVCALSVSGEGFCQTDVRSSSGPDSASTPRILVALNSRHRFRELRSGYGTNCALAPSGQAFCWGDGSAGSLGDGKFNYDGYVVQEPLAVATTLRFATLAGSGGSVQCGLATDSRTYCWGGQKGSTDPTPEMAGKCGAYFWLRFADGPCVVPTPVQDAPVFHDVVGMCGIDADGQAYCWGVGPDGQLGDGRFGVSAVAISPVPVLGGLAFAQITTGLAVCGRSTDNDAYCWGNNFAGYLGNGDQSVGASAVPVPVAGGIKFRTLAGGATRTCALSTSDELWCWGSGDYTPVRILLPP